IFVPEARRCLGRRQNGPLRIDNFQEVELLVVREVTGVVNKKAEVGRAVSRGECDARGNFARGSGFHAASNVFAAPVELAAKLRRQRGGLLVVGLVERFSRRGEHKPGNCANGENDGERKKEKKSSAKAHGVPIASQTFSSGHWPS